MCNAFSIQHFIHMQSSGRERGSKTESECKINMTYDMKRRRLLVPVTKGHMPLCVNAWNHHENLNFVQHQQQWQRRQLHWLKNMHTKAKHMLPYCFFFYIRWACIGLNRTQVWLFCISMQMSNDGKHFSRDFFPFVSMRLGVGLCSRAKIAVSIHECTRNIFHVYFPPVPGTTLFE